MSAPQLSNTVEMSDSYSVGNSNNPVSLDSEDDVIMEAPPPSAKIVQGQSEFSTEQELRDGLRRLDDLYDQLLILRIAAPKLIRTLTQIESTTTPSEVYGNFAIRVREILSEIDRFSTGYKNASDILAYANKSRAANPHGLERGTFRSLSRSAEEEEVKEENNDGDDKMIL
ncbi:hypothetical protein V1525DRAFT_394972 [Lipomyces kononenkoae]|uniref:Uncharacterized protein n=1 Tax=Lipomyces kononenkoae TaxID=34357 RepID=A0ACC3TA10_LIPKO